MKVSLLHLVKKLVLLTQTTYGLLMALMLICKHSREIFFDKLRGEVDSVVALVENMVHVVILAALDNLVIPAVQHAVRSANASSGRGPDVVVCDGDQKYFSANTEEVLHVPISNSLNSHLEINMVDETRFDTPLRQVVSWLLKTFPTDDHTHIHDRLKSHQKTSGVFFH